MRRHRRLDWIVWTVLAALGVALALGANALRENSARADEQEAQIAALQAQANAAVSTADQLCQQVRALGKVCVQDPAELPRGEQGEPGVQGPPGRGVVNQECTGGQWRVYYTDGYTDYDAGPCIGVTGPSGAAGKDGQDGAPGATGPAGADGKDGRGVADTQCSPDTGRWTVTYTDGATADGGPCMWRPGPASS